MTVHEIATAIVVGTSGIVAAARSHFMKADKVDVERLEKRMAEADDVDDRLSRIECCLDNIDATLTDLRYANIQVIDALDEVHDDFDPDDISAYEEDFG